MSESYFESALSALQKCVEKTKLLKILMAIRKEIELPRNKDNLRKLRETGCLKYIVVCLQSESGSILDVTLSILGNCCMDRNCARELVKQYNVLSNLLLILKRYPKQESVNGRIFRIIGNICQHWDSLWSVVINKEPQIVDCIVKFLNYVYEDDNKYSDATINMAIRALRELCNSQTFIPLVKKHKVLKTIGAILIIYTEKWNNNKSHESILVNIIRLLHEYSRYKYAESIVQLQNTDKGDALPCLGNLLTLAPQRIIKIVMNFIKIISLKSDLPILDIFEGIVKQIKPNDSIVKDSTLRKQYLQCLSMLLEHPANREYVRKSGAVLHSIDVLKSFDTHVETHLEAIISIISIMSNCVCYDAFANELLQGGIINVLVEKLEQLVGDSESIIVKHDKVKINKRKKDVIWEPIKRSRLDISYYPASPQTSDDDYEFNSPRPRRRSYSPSSGSELSFDSISSPSSPLISVDGNSDDSDDYSPVCSEVDENDLPSVTASLEDNETVISSYEKELTDNIEVESETETLNCSNSTKKLPQNMEMEKLKATLVTEMMKMLKLFATKGLPAIVRPPVIVDLFNSRLLTALIKSLKFVNEDYRDDMKIILNTILDSHKCLLPLMHTYFIPTIYESLKKQHNLCGTCSNLLEVREVILNKISSLAESDYGKGEIAHQLLRGDLKMKVELTVVVPYIIRKKSLLKPLMINCGGLQMLMKLLKEEKSEIQDKGIRATCVLAKNTLAINNPVDRFKKIKRPLNIVSYNDPAEDVGVVIFRLDDNSTVKADRDFLSNTSDYFNRLLNGCFKESQEKEVILRNVDGKSLKCLLNLLRLHVKRTELVKIELDLITLLDVLALTDRYLMEDLSLCLTRCIEQFYFTTETAPVIYRWSIESRTNFLRVEIVAFALVCEASDSDRIVMFQKMLSLGYTEQLVEDIRNLLVRYLNLKCL